MPFFSRRMQDAGFVRGRRLQMPPSQKELSQLKDFNRPSFPSATKLSYRIGGITFGLEAEGALLLTPERELAAFAVEAVSCDVNLQISWADSLRVPSSTRLFHSGGLCRSLPSLADIASAFSHRCWG